MTSMFDYDDSVNLAYNAKQAGKNLVTAKHELLERTGEFLFLAHSDREFALRCQMVEQDIEGIAFRRLASLSDSKAKLVHAAYNEWQLRHANCEMCKTAIAEREGDTAAEAYRGGGDEPDGAPTKPKARSVCSVPGCGTDTTRATNISNKTCWEHSGLKGVGSIVNNGGELTFRPNPTHQQR